MSGWVPIPREAIGLCTSQLERAAVLDLYQRANALRWKPFRVTERSLCTSWEMGNRRVWSLLADLERAGLLVVERGGKREPTGITVRCPTGESATPDQPVQHRMQHEGLHNERAQTPIVADSAAQDAALGTALLDQKKKEIEKTTQPDAWDRLSGRWRELHPGGARLTRGKGQGQMLKARIDDQGEEAVAKVLRWAHHSQHPRAVFLRDQHGLSLSTLCAAKNFETYLGFAAEERPAARAPAAPPPPVAVSAERKEALRAAIARRREDGAA